MIYTDGVHLISDKSLHDLHQFARLLGLKAEWFQWQNYPHYDLVKSVKNKDNTLSFVKSEPKGAMAVKVGAKLVSSRKIVEVLQQSSWLLEFAINLHIIFVDANGKYTGQGNVPKHKHPKYNGHKFTIIKETELVKLSDIVDDMMGGVSENY